MNLQLTARNASFEELNALLTVQQEHKHDAIVSAPGIHSEEGVLAVEGMSRDGGRLNVLPTEAMDGDIASKLGIPVQYLRTLRADHVRLYDENVNAWLTGRTEIDALMGRPGRGQDQRKFLVRTFADLDSPEPGIGRSLASDRFARIDHLDWLTAILDGVLASGIKVEVQESNLTEKRMSLKLRAPELRMLAPLLLKNYRNPWTGETAETDPMVEVGLYTTNSETGGSKASIGPFFHFPVCKNGMYVDRDAFSRVHLGGKQEEGIVTWSNETQNKMLSLVTSQARDAVTTFLNRDYMTAMIAEMTEKGSKPVKDGEVTVQAITNKLHYPEERREAILRMFYSGGQYTAAGVMQAFTATAQEQTDPDIAFELESDAFRALEMASA